MAEKIVIIEEALIASILSNPKLLADLPSIKAAAASKSSKPGCKPCAMRARDKIADYSKVKTVISNLRGESLAKFKEHIGADKIRILQRTDNGKIIQTTL